MRAMSLYDAIQRLPKVRALIRWATDFILGGAGPVDAAGRSRERHRRVLMSAGASVLAKAIGVATALISVPLTLHYLGNERYGMWMTMSSLVAMLSFADFGIGNGMLNVIAAAYGRDDRAAMNGAISSGFFSLTAVACLMVFLFALAYPFVPWPRIFNVSSPLARTEAGPAWAIFVVCFLGAIPANLGQRVQGALQRGFVASLWQCAGSVVALLSVLLVIALKGGLVWLVLAYVGTPLLIGALNSAVYFGVVDPDLRPRWSLADRGQALHVVRVGLLFFFLQIAVSINYGSDDLIISQILGPRAVPAYAIPERMFSTITMVMMMFLLPLWPAYAEAMARGEHDWARRTLLRSLVLAGGVTAIGAATLFVLARPLLALWVGHDVRPPMSLLAALAVWKVIEVCGTAVAMYLNAARVVHFQLIVSSANCAACVILKITLVRQIGVTGISLATIICYAIVIALPVILFLRMKVFPRTIFHNNFT
jgi:O-antigen/teichoic acid export membrane protein